MSTRVQLPTELLEKIILDAWSSPLSNEDRITLMTSSALVSTTWKSIFCRISHKDVHIPSPAYLFRFTAALAGHSPLFLDDPSLPRSLCQSITIKIPATAKKSSTKDNEEPPMGKTLTELLYFLDGILEAPNLRTLRIEYENMGFDDIFVCWRFAHFPEQVTDLGILFFFDRDTSTLGDVLRATHRRQNPWTLTETESEAYSLRFVQRLFISGASGSFAADMIACCPSAEVVTVYL
ncbi:hypothetical protein DXG01_013748 [Tephrocybe rancida]|nr:hypothetical protein DXG01_013748 [Tephrocybe rancida]